MGARKEGSAESEGGLSAIAAKNTSSSEIWEEVREGFCVTCCLLVRPETGLVSERRCRVRDSPDGNAQLLFESCLRARNIVMKKQPRKVRPNSSRSARLIQGSFHWLSCGGIESGSGLAGSSMMIGYPKIVHVRSCSCEQDHPRTARNMAEV